MESLEKGKQNGREFELHNLKLMQQQQLAEKIVQQELNVFNLISRYFNRIRH